jgi:hypothetical protein
MPPYDELLNEEIPNDLIYFGQKGNDKVIEEY